MAAYHKLMQLVSGPALGALSDRFGWRPVLLACLFGTSLAFLLLGLANSLTLIYLAIALDGITGGNLTTAYVSIVNAIPAGRRSPGMGLVGAALGLGLMAGAPSPLHHRQLAGRDGFLAGASRY